MKCRSLRAIWKFLLAGFLFVSTSGFAWSANEKPNVVFFLVDDLGWGDLGCYGSTFHETPAIDKLCSEGMKFLNGYSACAVCSPSRAAIMSGCSPARLHLTDFISGKRMANARLLIPDWKMKIDHERILLPEALKEADYSTHFIGKWHLIPKNDKKERDRHYPTSHGFDSNIAGREWGQPKGKGKYFHPWGMPNLEGGGEGDFLTDRLTDYAEAFIEANAEKPFFLYFSYYGVHTPIMCKPELEKKYAEKLKHGDFKGERTNPVYAGMLQSIDESVGRIMKKLESLNLQDNTIIIFTADNGGLDKLSSGGLRGAKSYSYEGGTRVAYIIKWPGVVKPGSVCGERVVGMDFYPTILDMAGMPLKPDQHLDGVSLLPLLKQTGKLERDTLYWHYPHYHKTNPYGSIIDKNWKLIEFFEDGRLELYDLNNDPAETTDLARKKPEMAQRLLARLQAWRREVGAQIMERNPDYDPSKKTSRAGRRKRSKSQP